jgi:uncharacterized repeat protein (TIGR02543 family)
LDAASFFIANSAVDGTNAQILDRSHAKAWTTNGVVVDTTVIQNDGYVQRTMFEDTFDFNPVIGIAEYSALTKSIVARVFNDSGEEGGGNGGNGALYSIYAKNFRINITDATALQAQAGTDAYGEGLLARSEAVSYLRNTSDLRVGGTPALAEDGDGGFARTVFAQPGDAGYPTHVPITFWVDEERATTTTINAIVSNGSYPTIVVPPIKSVELNATFGEAEYRQDVTAFDPEDKDITARVTYEDVVDTAKRGLYKVNYEVSDLEGNLGFESGFVAVGLQVIGDYVIDAFSFVKLADEVEGTSAEILEASRATAMRIRSNDPAEKPLLPVEVPVVVLDKGGYSKVVDEYSIRLGAMYEPGYDFPNDQFALITAKVIDRDVIGEDEDLAVTVHYVVAANNVEIRLSEVDGYVGLDSVAKALLIREAQAEAFEVDTDTLTPFDVDVTANDITAEAAVVGSAFDVTFVVKGRTDVAATVKFTVIQGNDPALNVGDPLIVPISATTALLSEGVLRQDVTAEDVEDGPLTSRVIISEPGTDHLPTINTAVAGVYPVRYAVTDNDDNTTTATRLVVVDDGRYEFINDDDEVGIDIIIGAKNFVVRQIDCLGTIDQAKALSYVEAYNATGTDLSSQVELVGGDLPQAYLDKELGVYSLAWTVKDPPTVNVDVYGSIIGDEYILTPVDKASVYTIAARDFTVNTATALNINTDQRYIDRANATVIKLVEAAADKQAILVDNDNFSSAQGVYRIVFGASDIALSELSVTISATVTDGAAPVIDSKAPIIIPLGPAGSPVIDSARIMEAGAVTVVDSEAVDPLNNPTGDITDYAQLIDSATGQLPSIAADQPGVYQVIIRVVDADGNRVEKKVALVVDDGNFVYTTPRADDSGFILRAHGFDIDLRDVTVSQTIEQIREQSEVQAWRNDAVPVAASVVDTGGYRDVADTYYPVVGIYDSGANSAPILINTPDLSKPIPVNVVDNYQRVRVTFDANGGVLVGPSVVTIVEPQTTLPYLPASPVRDGYTFRYWATAPLDGAQFTADTTLTSDITLYALWTEIPVTPVPEPTPPPSVPPSIIVNNPPGEAGDGGGTTYVTVEPGADTETATLLDAESPLSAADIPDSTPPLASSGSTAAGWALFDLLATILALILLVVFLIKLFFDHPRDEEYEEEAIDAQLWDAMTPDQRATYQARREADYQEWLSEQQKKANRQRLVLINAPVLLIVGVALVEALIILFTTQDFALSMSIVDNYSVIFALIVFVQLLTPLVAAIIHNSRRENQRAQIPTPTPPARSDEISV